MCKSKQNCTGICNPLGVPCHMHKAIKDGMLSQGPTKGHTIRTGKIDLPADHTWPTIKVTTIDHELDKDVATFFEWMGKAPVMTREQFLEGTKPMSPETAAGVDEFLKETRGYYKLDAEIADLVQKVKALPEPDQVKPNYYKFNIKGVQCNMFDIARALGLSLELFSALKYFRVKGDTAKRINDLQKAKQCIDMEIENLSKSLKPNNHA
jgi:hypothetical protein